jgi:D-beta-D-heptose 7-phosphate kinase / D-beta-D-heptose 1-phosphate adenosyltransferase
VSNLQTERNLDLIRSFRAAVVVVVGDVILDTYLDCMALGVANEAPIPLLQMSRQTHAPGGAANVANNLARLGVQTHLVGMVGQDPEARLLSNLLRDAGIRFYPLVSNRPTTHKTRVLSDRHYYLRLDNEDSSAATQPELTALFDILRGAVANANLIVVSDYDKGMVTAASAQSLESLARDHGRKIVADLKPQNVGYWRNLDVITPNLVEARALRSLLGLQGPGNSDESELARGLSRALACDVVLKLADRGIRVANESGKVVSFPALCSLPSNTSGAGDTVLSTLAAVLAVGGRIEEAAYLANMAAAVAVSYQSTHAVSADELRQRLSVSTA